MSEHIGEHIKAVFFDLDDTLVGTIENKWRQHKYVARRYYQKDLTDEELAEHWGKPFSELVCLLYGTDDAKQAMANNMAHQDEFPKELFPASVPILRHIKIAKKVIGIITATSRDNLRNDIQMHRIPPDLLDYTQTSDDTEFYKPDARVFNPAVKWLAEKDIVPNEVMYIGDGLHDMKAALGVGFSFLGVETGLISFEQFKANGASSIQSIANLSKGDID